MVAEEVPPVTPARLRPTTRRSPRHRVGVKRSREQTNRPGAAAAKVRPALDADPARPVLRPTMDAEGTGATSPWRTPTCSTRLPIPPRSLMAAPCLAHSDIEGTNPARTERTAGFTHGVLYG
jgi:hypothetical protein